jgi:predicted transcriptional regulator
MTQKSAIERSTADLPPLSTQKINLIAHRALEKKYNRLTHEALDDVDAGRVISHQAVWAWTESLQTDQTLPERL